MRISNRTIGVALSTIVVAMVGLSFASVPLYRVFCAVTGYGGTPQIALTVLKPGPGNRYTVAAQSATGPMVSWQVKGSMAVSAIAATLRPSVRPPPHDKSIMTMSVPPGIAWSRKTTCTTRHSSSRSDGR